MKALSMNKSSVRHLGKKVFLVCILVTYFDIVVCASVSNKNSEEDRSENVENENSDFLHRQSSANLATQQLARNMYLNTPASFGFPLFQQQVPFAHFQMPKQVPYSRIQSQSESKVKTSDTVNSKESNPTKENVKPKPKEALKKQSATNGSEVGTVESKTDDGSGRGCPGCVGGTCDPLNDPNTNISGIPLVQIIFGIGAGIVWALIFLFVYKNFKESTSGGYGYGGYSPAPAPQYGAPQPAYGAPMQSYGAPSTGYNTNRVSYANGYGRSVPEFSFNELSSWVWDAIDKFTTANKD